MTHALRNGAFGKDDLIPLNQFNKIQQPTKRPPDPRPHVQQTIYQAQPYQEPKVAEEHLEQQIPRNATVLEADSGLINSKQKLCALFLIFMVCAFGLVMFLVLFTGGRHKPHGSQQQEYHPVISSMDKTNVYQVENSDQMLTELTTYYYNIFLSEEIQQWQIFPDKDSCLPFVNMSNAKLASFDVCCFSDKDTWICSNGHTFDSYSFEARLKSTDILLGGVQCHIYINSRHLAKSQCTIEIKVMK